MKKRILSLVATLYVVSPAFAGKGGILKEDSSESHPWGAVVLILIILVFVGAMTLVSYIQNKKKKGQNTQKPAPAKAR